MIIGIDTGGTFTDFIFEKDGKLFVHKQLSTPKDPSDSVLSGVKKISPFEAVAVIHGSTVATNAVLERKGVKTALITNRGFEDVIEIGRQNREELYSLDYRREECLIPKNLRFGINGRINSKGEEVEPIDEEEIFETVEKIRQSGAESVAVVLLFSFAESSHELSVGKYLENSGIPFSLSHEIMAEFREFERTSTTAVNSYVLPIMDRYISKIENDTSIKSLGIMQSNGGRISSRTARKEPVRTILSGPAGGAVGAFHIAKLAGYEKIITFDMGGTSTDVSLMDKTLPLSVEAKVSSYPLKIPMIEIHTVGAGGGSIAHIDEGGALKVGPQSAGADPGPVCYGKGDKLTVTDADLFLGRLIPSYFLGGNMQLKKEPVEMAIKAAAQAANLSDTELAWGICSVANSTMERALRTISVERGYDPGGFTLLSFGGAGGLHAVFLARLLGIPRVLIPKNPGILSAEGMLLADIIKDYSLTVMRDQSEESFETLSEKFAPLIERGLRELKAEGLPEEEISLELFLDMRYKGQSFELTVPFSEKYIESFHSIHERRYGYKNEERETEIVNLRLKSLGSVAKPKLKKAKNKSTEDSSNAFLQRSAMVFDMKSYNGTVYNRDNLQYGNRISGPAVVVEYTSTTVLPPGSSAFVDEYFNLIVSAQDGQGKPGLGGE